MAVTDMPELLPCPFCPDGGRPVILSWELYTPTQWGAVCQKCGCQQAEYDTEAEAIAAWNTRYQPQPEDSEMVRQLAK